MKKLINSFLMVTLFGVMAVGVSFASDHDKEIKHSVTFNDDVYVNDMMIKRGTYHVEFDGNSNEVSIKKGNKVVATAKVTTENLADKPDYDTVSYKTTEKGNMLTSIKFSGEHTELVFSNQSMSVSGQ